MEGTDFTLLILELFLSLSLIHPSMYKSEIFPIARHARRCMHYIYYWGEQNHITFLGDSRIRQLYFEFVNLLSLKRVDELKAHQNLHFEDKKISVTAVCNLLGFFFVLSHL